MSRTYRNIAHANTNARRIQFKNQVTNTLYACQEMREEGYNPRARDKMLGRAGYLDDRDDFSVAAWSESTPIDQAVRALLDEKYGWYSYRVKVYSYAQKKVIWATVSHGNWDMDDYDYYFEKFERANRLKKTWR